jgi:CDP-6-deoxy-D-xylo-4-hexulose-3-dehydrase
MIVNPASGLDRKDVLERLKQAGIEYRIITGGNMLRHDVVRMFDYESTGSENADLAHYNGFFVGNHPVDVRGEIDYLWQVLKDL